MISLLPLLADLALAAHPVHVDQVVLLPPIEPRYAVCSATDPERPRVLVRSGDWIARWSPETDGWRGVLRGVAYVGPVAGEEGLSFTRWRPDGPGAEIGALDAEGRRVWTVPMAHLQNSETTPAAWVSPEQTVIAIGFHTKRLWLRVSPGPRRGSRWNLKAPPGSPWEDRPEEDAAWWNISNVLMISYDMRFRGDGSALLVSGEGRTRLIRSDGTVSVVTDVTRKTHAQFAPDGAVVHDGIDGGIVYLRRFDVERERAVWQTPLGPAVLPWKADVAFDVDRELGLWLVVRGGEAVVVSDRRGQIMPWREPPDVGLFIGDPDRSVPIVVSCGGGWMLVGRTSGDLALWRLSTRQ